MFALEDTYARIKRKSIEKAREEFRVNSQRQWRPDEPSDAEGINLPGRCAFAQNNTYLELCNPGWERRRLVVFGLLLVVPMALLIIWGWYGFAIHPILFNQVIMFWHVADRDPADWSLLWFGWLLLFPLAAASAFMLFAAFYYMGARSSFFTYARGRIRFNRLTRKVYVLRPGYCGGNQIFECDCARCATLLATVAAESVRWRCITHLSTRATPKPQAKIASLLVPQEPPPIMPHCCGSTYACICRKVPSRATFRPMHRATTKRCRSTCRRNTLPTAGNRAVRNTDWSKDLASWKPRCT